MNDANIWEQKKIGSRFITFENNQWWFLEKVKGDGAQGTEEHQVIKLEQPFLEAIWKWFKIALTFFACNLFQRKMLASVCGIFLLLKKSVAIN